MPLLDVQNIQRIYRSPFSSTEVHALNGIDFKVEPGEFTAVMGESGSGKTTLLKILAGLDSPSAGRVSLEDRNISELKGRDLSDFRRNHLGFVFQDFNLLDTFTCYDNIALPMVLAGKKPEKIEAAIQTLAGSLNIKKILKKYPYEISGGQKQLVAAARALVCNPSLLLADEPTGSLDSKSSQEMLNLFGRLNEEGQTILMVTHSVLAASHANRVLFIKDGKIFHQIYKGERTRTEFFDAISQVLTVMQSQEGRP